MSSRSRQLKRFGWVLLSVLLPLYVSCGDKEEFTEQAVTQFYTQGFNPPNLDILWMIDNRSGMYQARDHLLSEATAFFKRVDGLAGYDYRMAFVNHDMVYTKAALLPKSNPVTLSKKLGTLEDRSVLFSNILSQIVNLTVGYKNEGLESVRTALLTTFKPRAGVPLVLIFVSDSDDRSSLRDGSGSAINYYVKAFQQMKDNRSDLLRVYSINYLDSVATDQTRCATRYQADIDSPGFENRFNNVADALKGSSSEQVKGDLCQNFASFINLNGLRLKELPKRFHLDKKPAGTPIVSVFRDGVSSPASYKFDSATNDIVFDTAPPEGTTIQITFHPGV